MSDVTLVINQANQAIEDMVQANTVMVNALENMLTGITPAARSFEGATAEAWKDFQSRAQTAIQQMNNAFGQGAASLEQMVDQQIRADHTGANAF
ncbi:hypothetical protein AB0E75_10530 [Streptomyces griseoviridis]|jgi:uncharacterized protein YukE|uniref:ESAT-6-like protein n=3 Tax=Streptomyces TaxID=1883 RepID=A0A918LFV7_STRGD|nr:MULTISPECIES: hypothetical protein [Streptomyces]MDP9685227.1 uncharacterized protein YukE [Streptomyces griseoviridis]GGS41710.1 hypothetical protein GCM10010238_34120 [Streptomyces niveoruber]GGS95697.1 hypothetical protein GCM10010240_31280 [Streptomyces griseoviridis]GGU31956.1 hypothetical protein GCM10010259_23070 [Streptomyces daghestanicus]GHI32827.1 hypothetical protein Sdagh_45570 [Streptomyces daghestanicus]